MHASPVLAVCPALRKHVAPPTHSIRAVVSQYIYMVISDTNSSQLHFVAMHKNNCCLNMCVYHFGKGTD
jgi:hypothetical protein